MNITGDMPLRSALDVVAWVVNQRILSNGNKSGTCSPIIKYIKRSRREILISIKSDIKLHLAKDPNQEDQRYWFVLPHLCF